MTHDPALVEAMARGIDGYRNPYTKPNGERHMLYAYDATAALTALCAARPDVAAVLKGEAVALPKAPTDAQWNHIAAVLDAHPASLLMERQRRWWPDLVSASPYAREPGQ